MNQPLIELDGIDVSFDGGNSFAVRNVAAEIARRSFVVLIGPSGSGKTTLLKTMNGLIAPTAGRVRIEGADIAVRPGHDLRRGIGYVIQSVGLFPHMSVADNIGVTPSLLGWPRDRIAARVRALLEMVELPADFAARAPAMLSGGQAQRVGIARALAAEPAIVLMDEPFGALDPLTRDTLATAYRALHDRLGLTTLLVTHDMQEAALLADRIIVMRGGRVVCEGSPKTLLTSSQDPEVSHLLNLPRRQAERIRNLIDARGEAS